MRSFVVVIALCLIALAVAQQVVQPSPTSDNGQQMHVSFRSCLNNMEQIKVTTVDMVPAIMDTVQQLDMDTITIDNTTQMELQRPHFQLLLLSSLLFAPMLLHIKKIVSFSAVFKV
uniref:Uncharacterized protein n=1 Tax=Panagrolaimus sp. ES5 TaxID=591445 RepID=A0AC34FV06_9BILA